MDKQLENLMYRHARKSVLRDLQEFLAWVVEAKEFVPCNDEANRTINIIIQIVNEWTKEDENRTHPAMA